MIKEKIRDPWRRCSKHLHRTFLDVLEKHIPTAGLFHKNKIQYN